jgi:hypothetical protein
MEAFYKITILVFIVFLILALTVIGILMGKKSNAVVYPPVANTCPDYWTQDGSGNCIIPNQYCTVDKAGGNYSCEPNVLNGMNTVSGTTPGLVVLNDPKLNKTTLQINFQKSTTCDQKKWAMQNNIVWDGVSNYNSC